MQGLGKAPKWRASPGASFPLPFLTSWAITRCRGRFSFRDISDYELVIKAVYLSWHARFVGHSPPSWRCVPMVWSRSGLMIHKHSGHGASKEPMNPCKSEFIDTFHVPWPWVPSGGLPVGLLLKFYFPGSHNHRSNCNFRIFLSNRLNCRFLICS